MSGLSLNGLDFRAVSSAESPPSLEVVTLSKMAAMSSWNAWSTATRRATEKFSSVFGPTVVNESAGGSPAGKVTSTPITSVLVTPVSSRSIVLRRFTRAVLMVSATVVWKFPVLIWLFRLV
jgi:hypothetical protein